MYDTDLARVRVGVGDISGLLGMNEAAVPLRRLSRLGLFRLFETGKALLASVGLLVEGSKCVGVSLGVR